MFCRLKCFDKAPDNRIEPYELDANDSAVMTATFANGALGTLHVTRWASGHADRLFLKISGTKGAVEMDTERASDRFRLCAGEDLDRAQWRDVSAPPVPTNFGRFVRSVISGEAEHPDFARGAEVQQVIDACFASHERNAPVMISAPSTA